MAFADYLDLRTAVIEMVGKPDIADVFERLTKLAESRLNRVLRMQQQITETTITLTSGSATLPSDFAELIGVYDANGSEFITKTLADIQDDDTTVADGTYNIQYYAKLPTLTASHTTTNWLLSEYPDVYLYAVGHEAARQVRDVELIEATGGMRMEAIDEARGNDEAARYSRARIRVKGPTP